jgi:DNA repair exonuclease SbcCD nuclease subunit
MTRFVHAADLQLGKASNFLAPEARDRYRQARTDAIRAIARVVAEEKAEFVVVAGDVFDSNDVDRPSIVRRALDALGEIGVPVFLLPGNHDHLGLRSVWHAVADLAPSNVVVLDDSVPRQAVPGVEVVGAPWTSKRPLDDPAGPALIAEVPAPGIRRVVVAHGIVDSVFPVVDRIDQRLIRLDSLEAALQAGACQYVALGDRHSVTEVGSTGRVWYPGSPEPTSWDETEPGHVLVVDLGERVQVRPVRVGCWSFDIEEVVLESAADVAGLIERLRSRECKELRAVRIVARGSLAVTERAELAEQIADLAPAFGALELYDTIELLTRPDEIDAGDLGLAGFERDAFDQLVAAAAAGGEAGELAAEALVLLDQLVRRAGLRRAA